MQNLDIFNDRRPYILNQNPNKYRHFLENVYTETWNKRNQDAVKYYNFLSKNWASRVAFLFSYDADKEIMQCIFRYGIPIV